MSVACCQCGKTPAIYQVGGHPLCLDCAYKVEQINHIKQMQYMQEINYLTEQMESLVGLPGMLPRYEMPKLPPIIKHQGGITLNNINVENSVIGAINTGNIGQIDVALTNIKNGGNTELAQIIKEFTEAVLKEQSLTNKTKNEIIEQLSFLASQAVLPKEGQKRSIIRTILEAIKKSLESLPAVLKIFEILKKMLEY